MPSIDDTVKLTSARMVIGEMVFVIGSRETPYFPLIRCATAVPVLFQAAVLQLE